MGKGEKGLRPRVDLAFILLLYMLIPVFGAIGELHSAPGEQAQPSPPAAVKLGENLYRIGRLTVDMEKREVTIRGWVNMNAGLVEYLACSAGGKLHESALVLDAKPMDFQVALILLGLEAQEAPKPQSPPRLPKGDPVEIWVQWKEREEIKRVRAEQMLLDRRREKPMQETQWVFTGSMIYQGRFIAEIERSLIATYHDPAAIINNPRPEAADDTIYSVNSEVVPKRGTAITLIVKAIAERKSNSDLPSRIGSLRYGDQYKKEIVLFQENFDAEKLDTSRWKPTQDGDFNQFAVDVQPADDKEKNDHRLRLMVNTLGTSDPVKYLGVRSMEKLDLGQLREISFDLDWNDQQNGCYLTAALYVCPVESNNPKNEKDWIKFEWTGVPPGKNIRTNVWANVNGALKQLYTDWGPRGEDGRPLGWPVKPGKHRIKLLFDGKGIRVWADSKQLCYVNHSANFTAGYLYLQMSSGTNYPGREVYFDNITVTAKEKE